MKYLLILSVGLSSLLDAIATWLGLTNGFISEGNPLMVVAILGGFWVFMAIKFFAPMMILWIMSLKIDITRVCFVLSGVFLCLAVWATSLSLIGYAI
jgi:hypothetical protein